MKKIFRKFHIINIDVFIYVMDDYLPLDVPNFKYEIVKKREKNKWFYSISEDDRIIHRSYLFDNVFLLKSINKNGPVIGNCFTDKEYRGQSIYPYVLNKIAKEVLINNTKEIFVIVNADNLSSIRGIEKAGFSILASIKAKRWLWFYLKRKIDISNTYI